MQCLFCDFASKIQPTEVVYEDDQVVAFKDIAPKAPVHILLVPKKHVASVDQVEEADEPLVGHLIFVAKQLARDNQIHESGYRLVFNTKKHAGQVIDHLHLHLLGGKPLGPMVS